VWVSMLVGVVLMLVFVWHAFRPAHPLLDLRLFTDRNLTVSTITMFLFAAAFFGGLLLVPTYFQQVRGESTLNAGLLVAPQGIGAMLTMPIAGTLVDRIPVGRIVPVGMVLIAIGMFGLTQIQADTSYQLLIALLFVMGLGMGATMMPLFTTALKTLTNSEVARGSTLLNITQQIASSVGVAVISVVLTNQLKGHDLALPAIAAQQDPRIADQIGGPVAVAKGLTEAAESFATTYWLTWVLILITLIPVFFLPRRHQLPAEPAEEDQAPFLVH
jgi:predicted MFS family arabinose efflux permease